MWLEQEKFREIDHAVVKGERRGLSRLLSELFHPENQKFPKNPTLCPKCQKTLERKMHPYLEYFVQACPDRHGAWISPEVSDKLKQFVSEQITLATKKKQAVQLVIALAVGMVLFPLLSQTAPWLARFSSNPDNKISEQHWPERSFENFPELPIKESTINNPDEMLYLTQVLRLLETGASNRMNIDAVLHTRRSEEKYWKAFGVYQEKHQEFLMKLRLLFVPESLREFHAKVETAAQAQLEFYAAFIQAKIQDPSLGLQGMLNHPALQTCNRELLSAFDGIQKQYPNLDAQSRQAIEGRLCWFDIV
jgi:hypothetical protein